MNEVERTYNSQKFDNGDGTFTLNSHIKPIFYDSNGTLVPIELGFQDMGGYFQAVKNNARIFVNKDFLASQLILWHNDFKGAGQTVTYDPKNLLWVNKNDYTDFQIFRTPQASTGVLINPTTIRYENAYGLGIHFEIVASRTQFKKEIVIDSLSALTNPPTAQHLLVASFKFGGNVTEIKRSDGTVFNGNTLETDNGEFSFDGKSVMRRGVIYDKDGKSNAKVPIFWRDTAQGIMQFKVIPRSFLLSPDTVFPVRADTTTSYNVGSTDRCIRSYSTSFTTARDGDGTIEVVYDTTTTIYYTPGYNIGGPNHIFWHLYLPVDTSGLGSSATISAASMYTYHDYAAYYTGTDANSFFAFTEYTDPTPPPTADAASWDYIGKTTYSSGKQVNTYTSGWNSHDFTSFGIINKTGTSQIMYTTGLYINTVASAPGKDYWPYIQASEGANPPYLSVTYTSGATAEPESYIIITS